MVGGEWRMKTKDGSQMIETWQWGPGKKSLKVVTHGFNASDNNFPWRDIEIIYWHPMRKEIRMLGISPMWRGVREGVVTAKGGKLSGTIDLYQTVGTRRLGWSLEPQGANTFFEALASENPAGKMERFVDWTFERNKSITPMVYPKKGTKIEPSAEMMGVRDLVTERKHPDGGSVSFVYVPYADAIYFSSSTPAKDGRKAGSEHGLIYYHTGAKERRYFAISSSGEVSEGTVRYTRGFSWEIKMKRFSENKVRGLTKTLTFFRHGEFLDETFEGSKVIEERYYPGQIRKL